MRRRERRGGHVECARSDCYAASVAKACVYCAGHCRNPAEGALERHEEAQEW